MATSSKVCSVCLNSADDNNICHLCDGSVCKGCIILPEIPRVTNVKFACPSCYPKKMPYKGLLDGTTLAPSPDWPPVKIGPFLGRLSSKPKDLHIAILSLFLKDSHSESVGSSGRVLGEYLRGQCDCWKVVDHRISFDFGGSSHLNYQESFQAFVKNVVPNSLFVVSITTDSIRDGKCVLSNPLGITIHGSLSELLHALLPIGDVARQPSLKFFIFISITNKPIWTSEDIESTLRYMEGIPFIHIVAFEGQGRHEGSFIPFLITLAQNIFIEGFDLTDRFRFLLPAAMPFEHHTNILHLRRTQDMLHVQRWTWMHKDVKPWGKILPAQCPGCSAIHTLESHRKERKAYTFKCKNCCHIVRFEPEPNDLVTGPTLSGGRWMRRDIR